MPKSIAAVVALTLSSVAFAQQDAPPPPPPPPDAPLAATEMSDPVDDGRVRWGVNAQLGFFLPQTAFVLGAEARVGYQFNRMLAVYGDFGGNVGFGVGAKQTGNTVSASVSAVAYWYFGALAELTVADFLNVAAGPVLASGAWAGVSGTASGSTQGGTSTVAGDVVAVAGWMPGIDIKAGLGFGRPNPRTGRRGGFNLGVNLLTLFAPNAVYTKTEATAGGANVEVKTQGLAVGFVPTLTLGFDAR